MIQHEIAYGGFHQDGEVTACSDGDCYLADWNRQYFLVGRIHLQPIEVGKRLVAVVLEIDDQSQQLARAHCRLAEDRADVQDTDAAHFEKIAQDIGAAPFDRVRRNTRQLDDVVGDQAVAAR